tara:strand:- start:677 stop:955 length:279 start_codon:yes stop_codon:yes gene_type:complete
MPLIKIIKDERELIVPERLAKQLIESSEAVFLDVVLTKSEVIAKHLKQENKAKERAKKRKQKQREELKEARNNERLEKIEAARIKRDLERKK